MGAVVAVYNNFTISKEYLTAENISIFVVACYLVGLFIDPIADYIDTSLINNAELLGLDIFPSYYLLKDGYCRGITLAHNVKVRYILNKDALENETYDNQKGGTIKGIDKVNIWNNTEDVKLLFNYAKNRAFVCAEEYQLDRLKNYFQLFIFYRNMIYTSSVSMAILVLFGSSMTIGYKFWIALLIPLFIYIFYTASYKYRAYYCRMILGCVYCGRQDVEEAFRPRVK